MIASLYTGVRRSEMLALRWSDVDLDQGKLRVTGALEQSAAGIRLKGPKTASGRRTISLPPAAVEVLRAHRRVQLELAMRLGLGRPPEDALLFPGEDGGYDKPRAFAQRWERTIARLGLPAFSWHSLRHAHASALIRAGRPLTEIAARLGHANAQVTLKTYAHLFDTDDLGSADAIEKAFG
jgi:integrase